jgi:acyl-CoA synthetase (NDP forming)
MAALDALFRPRSVAIIGASADPNKVGGRPLAFLRKAGFRGAIYPVNPAADEVQGLRAYASLAEIEAPIDQAIVAVPARQVPAVAEQCIAREVKALQVFSAGFGEGREGRAAETRLAAMARRAGMRVLGPNSLGLFNTADGFFGTFATALDGAWPRTGRVGVATQSGAFGSYFFGLAQRRGLGFSHFVATGNESDVDLADCIDFLAEDADTGLIVTAMEGCRDGRRLAAALLAARRAGKRVLAMKVGVSKAGAQAATTHTGALSGEDRVLDAVLRDCGAFRASSLGQLVDTAYAASIGPLPAGRDLLVVTTSGGIGVLVADVAEASGLCLPQIADAALDDIRAIAALADGGNPVDTSAGILGDLGAYARIAERALAEGPFDTVICFLAHIARNPAHWAQLRGPLYELRARYPDIAFAAVLLADDEIVADLEAHRFTVFADPSRAVGALAALVQPAVEPSPPALQPPKQPGRMLHTPLATEPEAVAALSAQGITFVAQAFVRDAVEAERVAHWLGFPLVVKVVSPDIPHKTEAGGVMLGIASDIALREAFAATRARVLAFKPDARIDGFIVARQLVGGVEVLVGTKCDAVFGPVVTVASGGVLTELVRDVAVRLAPVDAAAARRMLLATRAGQLVQGFRGRPAADIDALVRMIVILSEIAWANRTRVASIELNPVLALPEGAFALDCLVAMQGETP